MNLRGLEGPPAGKPTQHCRRQTFLLNTDGTGPGRTRIVRMVIHGPEGKKTIIPLPMIMPSLSSEDAMVALC